MEQIFRTIGLWLHLHICHRGHAQGLYNPQLQFYIASLQILDYGLVLHPGSYLREMWNCMDLIVVSCAITSFTMDMM